MAISNSSYKSNSFEKFKEKYPDMKNNLCASGWVLQKIDEAIDEAMEKHTHTIDEIIDFPMSFYDDDVQVDMTAFYKKFDAQLDYMKEKIEYVQSQIKLHATKDPIDHPKGSVTTEKIINNAVVTSKISDLNVTAEKLANSLDLTGKTIKVSSPFNEEDGGE